jgi:general secretion pathway protein N
MKALMALMALLLGGVLALQWHDWRAASELPAISADPAGAQVETEASGRRSAADAELLPRDEYAEVVERPLFLPDRRPPPPLDEEEPEVEPPETTELDGVDLTAVIITPDEVSAWLRAPGEPKLVKRLLGEEFLGWTVKTIEPALVVFERQDETDEIHLRDYANAPQPIPPTRLSPRGQARRDAKGAPTRADGSATDPPTRRQPARRPNQSPRTREPMTRRPATPQAPADTTDPEAPIRRQDANPQSD